MHHVEKATLVPAQCMFTRSHEGPFIDFGVDFDFDHVGRIYVKESFAREMGVFCGLPSLEEVAELRKRQAAQMAANDQLASMVEEKDQRILELEAFRDEALAAGQESLERLMAEQSGGASAGRQKAAEKPEKTSARRPAANTK